MNVEFSFTLSFYQTLYFFPMDWVVILLTRTALFKFGFTQGLNYIDLAHEALFGKGPLFKCFLKFYDVWDFG